MYMSGPGGGLNYDLRKSNRCQLHGFLCRTCKANVKHGGERGSELNIAIN